MRKLFLLLFIIGFCSTVNAKQIASITDIYKLTNKQFDSCEVGGFDLYRVDKGFRDALDSRLKPFGELSAKDFDMSECFNKRNIQNEVITTYFWQKHRSLLGVKITSYISFDTKTKKMLVVLLDEKLNTYILGNKDKYLIDALKNSRDNADNVFDSIDFQSNRSFSDFGRLTLVPSKGELLALNQKKYDLQKNDLACNAIFTLSEKIMTARQSGVDKADQLKAFHKEPRLEVLIEEYVDQAIEKAYKIKIFEDSTDKFAISKGFAYQTYFDCKSKYL